MGTLAGASAAHTRSCDSTYFGIFLRPPSRVSPSQTCCQSGLFGLLWGREGRGAPSASHSSPAAALTAMGGIRLALPFVVATGAQWGLLFLLGGGRGGQIPRALVGRFCQCAAPPHFPIDARRERRQPGAPDAAAARMPRALFPLIASYAQSLQTEINSFSWL